ncbi:MAG TPA: GerMN domain-containing protein [Vicinamibacterales bacterium]|nr:GerMN domain-containing protein [Vicinamibacterales bacterium]
MSGRAKIYLLAIVVAAAGVTWALMRIFLPKPSAAPAATVTAPAPTETAHITATLYYGSSDGRALVPVRRDVPAATSVVDQGRQILGVQFQDAPQPYVQVIPKGTKLRAFYVTERGEAFVDLSGDVVSAHPGGSLTELLTIYAIVNAVTTNLPAVQRVQLLVEGKEVDTIAGHVDVRRPLEGDATLVREGRAGGTK